MSRSTFRSDLCTSHSTRRTKAMNARHFVKMWAAALLLSPALVFAQIQIQPLDPGIRRLPALPDLVADVALGADCRIMVMVKNNGPGIVPDAGYSLSPPGSSGVQMYNDGSPCGGIVLGELDSAHSSQPADAT